MMYDGWTNGKGRILLHFLVHCPKGTMFIKFVDASKHVKDAALLCELLVGFIQEMSIVIIDNAANYVASGKLLTERYPHIVLKAPHVDIALIQCFKMWAKSNLSRRSLIRLGASQNWYITMHLFLTL